MMYADVAVDAPVSPDKTFSYIVPDNWSVEIGQLVWLPFGSRTIQGIIINLSDTSQSDYNLPISSIVEPGPLISPLHLSLGLWISRYYFSSAFQAISLFLPPGFKSKVTSVISTGPQSKISSIQPPETSHAALQALATKRRMKEQDFTKLLGKRGLEQLLKTEHIKRRTIIPRAKTHTYESYLVAAQVKQIDPILNKLNDKQLGLLSAVQSQTEPYPTRIANKEFGRSTTVNLVNKGLLGMEWVRQDKNPTLDRPTTGDLTDLILTQEQRFAVETINGSLDNSEFRPRTFLLHGVTGSGKTEVYLRAIDKALEQGKQILYLLPEISLTPQTVSRLTSRFPGKVATIHSRIKSAERFEQWWRIRDGEYPIVLGPRSAIFAPLENLGLIIIDEEHEWTYKQELTQPLYDARLVASHLAQSTNSVMIRGSATPEIEGYHDAAKGISSTLLELPHRIKSQDNLGRPTSTQVKIRDMRAELRNGNRSIFSKDLAEGLRDCIQNDHQAILFLNRRGSAPFVQCRDCGHVITCRSCSLTLTFHSIIQKLICHGCNRKYNTPSKCSQCGGLRIRELGIGTQKVIEELYNLLPGASVERCDTDASRSGDLPEETMARLATGQTQVLVGTQMITKGLDIPNVTLVGAILADIGLNAPDFRAGERVFNLLCQVAGRAGRGQNSGSVIIQTYKPDNYAIASAASQNYHQMYHSEIRSRFDQGNPPFNKIIQFRFRHSNTSTCEANARKVSQDLKKAIQRRGLSDIQVIGPAPATPQRIRGHYRWNLMIKGQNLHQFLYDVGIPTQCQIDVDPVHTI